MYRDRKIGAVVLAYNVQSHVSGVLDAMPGYVDAVYVVDDASADLTADAIRGWCSNGEGSTGVASPYPYVRFIQHPENRGPGAALSSGYAHAMNDGMDIVVKVDGDNQMDLGEMERLLEPIVNGEADYAKGDRLSSAALRRGMPRFRLVGNLLLTRLTRIASGNRRLTDSQNGYTAISRRALMTIGWNLYPYYGYLNELLVRLNAHGLAVADVPMVARYGPEQSSIRLRWYVPRVSALMLRLFLWRVTRRRRACSACAVGGGTCDIERRNVVKVL